MAGIGDAVEQYISADSLEAKTEQWIRDIEAYSWRSVENLEAAGSALLVVDMTRPFVDPGRPLASPNAPVIVPRIQQLLQATIILFHKLDSILPYPEVPDHSYRNSHRLRSKGVVVHVPPPVGPAPVEYPSVPPEVHSLSDRILEPLFLYLIRSYVADRWFSVITNISAGFQCSGQILLGDCLGSFCGCTNNYLDVLFGKQVLGAHSHTAGDNYVCAALGQPPRQ